MKSSSFFNNVSSFIKRYQPQTSSTTSTINEKPMTDTFADKNFIAEPR
jgi:hypothetical protein